MTGRADGDVERSTGPGFRPDVQGLRTIAVVMVVVFHSTVGLPGGFLGVDVFFVISGFVIGRLLLDEFSSTGRVSLGRFYSRRVRRLLPALSVLLVFVALVDVAGVSPLGGIGGLVTRVGIAAALYVANLALIVFSPTGYFALTSNANPLLHTWTLAVEEQFYLFFPLLLIAAGWVARRARWGVTRTVGVVLAVVAVVSFVVGALLAGAFGSEIGPFQAKGALAFYLSPTRAWEFLAGVLIVFAEPRVRRLGPRFAVGASLVGAGLLVGAALSISERSPTPGFTTLVPVAGAVLVIVAGSVGRHPLWPVLSSKPFVWLGDRSYGWYLWHWPLIVYTRASFPEVSSWVLLAVGVAALVPTELSYRFLEVPIRHDAGWRGRRAVQLAAVCSGVPIALFVVVAVLPTPGGAGVAEAVRGARPHLHQTSHCTFMLPDDPRVASDCTWAPADAHGRIVLVGDSSAGALSDVLRARAEHSGAAFVLAAAPGCPFADVEQVFGFASQTEQCRRFVTEWTAALRADPPSLVVLASRETGYIGLDEYTFRDPTTGRDARTSDAKARLWQQGLTRTLRSLSASRVPTVVVATVPQLEPFDIRFCAAWRLWTSPDKCGVTRSRAEVDADRRQGADATRGAVDASGGAVLVDFADELCPQGSCRTYRDGVWVYRDASHLSVTGAETLAPAIDREIIAVAHRG